MLVLEGVGFRLFDVHRLFDADEPIAPGSHEIRCEHLCPRLLVKSTSWAFDFESAYVSSAPIARRECGCCCDETQQHHACQPLEDEKWYGMENESEKELAAMMSSFFEMEPS